MPNALIREGFLDSEAVHRLSDPAECFYHRLLLAVDDAGRMDGRMSLLRAKLFPIDPDRNPKAIEAHLQECVAEGLVIPYEWDGKRYLQVVKVHRRSPSKNSRFPWKDGNYAIQYLMRQTRDGNKEFVSTSLSHTNGMPMGSTPLGGQPTVDGDVVGDGVDNGSPSAEIDMGPDEALDRETGEIKKRKPRVLEEPSLDEVVAEGARVMLPKAQCEAFYEHHCARGWISKGSKIRNWKYAMKTWVRNFRSGAFSGPTVVSPADSAPDDSWRKKTRMSEAEYREIMEEPDPFAAEKARVQAEHQAIRDKHKQGAT